MKKEKKNKIKKWCLRVGIGFLCFAGGLAGTFFLVPNRVNTVKFDDPEPVKVEDTYFSKFISKVTKNLGLGGEEEESGEAQGAGNHEPFGLKANIDELEITWPNNSIVVGGEISTNIRSLSDLDLTLDLDVNYNNKNIDLAVGLVDSTLYVACKDLKLKTCFVDDEETNKDFMEMFDKIINLFFNPQNEDGIKIDVQLYNIINALLGTADLGSLTSGLAFTVEETEDDLRAYSNLELNLDENTNLGISLTFIKESLSLESVVVEPVQIGEIALKAKLDVDMRPDIPVYALDDERYTYKQRGKFVETFNYASWIDSIFNLLKTRTVGLDVSAAIVGKDKSFGVFDASIDLDASRFSPLDIVGTVIGPELFGIGQEPVLEAETEQSAFSANDIIDTLNNFDFNVGLKLANMKEIDGEMKRVDYSNLSLAYFKDGDEENNGYLTFNEEDDSAVMKAKIDIPTINFLIDEVPELVNSISKKGVKKSATEEEPGLFDFITSSELITAIYKGKYDGIIDMIKTLKSTEKTIEISVNLSSLGFGDNSEINLVLDAENKEDGSSKVLSIGIQNVVIGEANITASISTRKYNKNCLEKINQNRNTYDRLDFVPGTFEQVEKIINTKQAGITLSGSVLDEEKLGFKFDGWAQLDYNLKNGMGHINFDEYKYSPTKAQTPHTVDISIDDFDGDHANNNMFFEYRENLRGRFTLKTFDDIIDVVLRLIENDDSRFTKFLQPIIEKVMGSVLVQSIQNQDYLQLTKSSLLKSIKQTNDGNSIEIVISRELLFDMVDSDLDLKINFKEENGKKVLSSVDVLNLKALGKEINVNITLTEFDANRENPVDLTKTFLDFSDIAVLLEFGINTTELTYFHLTADVSLNLGKKLNIPLDNIKLDFHIYVNGTVTKVYGKMLNEPVPTRNSKGFGEFVFEPDTTGTDDIGGTFYIYRETKKLFNSWSKKYYVSDSKNFLDNIAAYLLNGFLGIDLDLSNLDLGSNKKEKDPQYENIFGDKGFQYIENEAQNKYTWNTGISIEALAELDIFDLITTTIIGKKVNGVGYLSQIKANTSISLGFLSITLGATIDLVDPNPEVKDWPASVESRYQTLIGVYHSLNSDAQKSLMNNLDGMSVAI